MCTQPITIKNPRKHFIHGVDKEYLKVPCGHCFECRQKRRNELYLLSYFEYLNAKYRGGFTQFFTLTYDDAHLPHYAFRECFSRDDVKNYFKRVVSACRREFGKDFKLRRLVTCEYGKLHSRPHYHFLVFVQSPCNHFKFRQILKSCWKYGFSFGSWDNFGEVNRPNGIRYVTKYVCKDSFDDEKEKSWLQGILEDRLGLRHYYGAKRHCAFTLHSKKFGFCALDHILNDVSFIPKHMRTSYEHIVKYGTMQVPCGERGVPELVQIPRSLYRRLFYFITYRYKRVTYRDIKMYESHGSPIPKHKIQSYYIPNIHYKERFPYEYINFIDKTNDKFSLCFGSPNSSLARYSWFSPDYTFCAVDSKLDEKQVLDKLCYIKMNRDSVFGRCPLTKEFYYERAPIEKDSYPDIQQFISSLYDSDSSALLRRFSSYLDNNSSVQSSKNLIIERTYRDNKLCA